MRHYLIAYDITEKKRLSRIYAILGDYAIPLQKSLFCFIGGKNRFNDLVDKLTKELTKEDDLRIYLLSKGSKTWEQKPASITEGIFLAY